MIVRVRGVKRVRAKGRRYDYHRETGLRITSPPNTAAFIAEVQRLDQLAAAGIHKPARREKERGSLWRQGTWGELQASYRGSPEFARLAPRTKRDYDLVLGYLEALADMPLVQITSAACLKIRDRAFAQRRRRFANYVVHMLSVVLGWGKRRSFVAENAAAGVEKIAAPRDAKKPNRAWTDDECRIVLEEVTGGLRIAVGLGMFAGMRGGDVVRAGWSAYDGQTIEWRQGKTGDLVSLPIHQELRVILDQAPRVATTIVTGALGRPWTEATLRKEFRTLIVRLERAGRVRPGLTFHGLRSTAGKVLADMGADVRAIQALLGHRTAAMALHYSSEADRRRAATAAVHMLERKGRR
jgi:integrase